MAEDVVADTFEKLLRVFHRYDTLEQEEMHRLLVKMLKNQMIDWQRKKEREKSRQVTLTSWQQDMEEKGAEENPALMERAWELYQERGGIEEYSLRRETLHSLLKHLAELPEQSRNIFLMCHYEGWKPREIADKLGLQIKTVNQQLYRTKLKLKEKMKEDGYEEGEGYF